MKIRCISLKTIKMHELHGTIRLMKGDLDRWTGKSEKLGEIQDKAIRSFIKISGQLLLSYLMVTSLRNGQEIRVKISDFEAAIPAAYFFFTISFMYWIASIAFNHLSAAISIKSALAKRMLLPGFSANAYDLLNNQSENALGIPVHTNSFLKEIVPFSVFFGIVLLMSMFCILMIFSFFGFFLITQQIVLFSIDSTPIPEKISAVVGIILVSASILYVIVFHLPIPFRKNTQLIRWGFLYKLEPHSSDRAKFERWNAD